MIYELSSIIEVKERNLEIIQEALDSNKNWRPIQAFQWSDCGASYSKVRINPKHYLVFKIPLYSGNFHTDIRLKVHGYKKVFYSNSYKGWINHSQFNIPMILTDGGGSMHYLVNFLENE